MRINFRNYSEVQILGLYHVESMCSSEELKLRYSLKPDRIKILKKQNEQFRKDLKTPCAVWDTLEILDDKGNVLADVIATIYDGGDF